MLGEVCSHVVAGLDEALEEMSQGEQARILLSPDLAYGTKCPSPPLLLPPSRVCVCVYM